MNVIVSVSWVSMLFVQKKIVRWSNSMANSRVCVCGLNRWLNGEWSTADANPIALFALVSQNRRNKRNINIFKEKWDEQ